MNKPTKQYTITQKRRGGRTIYTVCRVMDAYPWPVPVGGQKPWQFASMNAALDRLHELTRDAS